MELRIQRWKASYKLKYKGGDRSVTFHVNPSVVTHACQLYTAAAQAAASREGVSVTAIDLCNVEREA